MPRHIPQLLYIGVGLVVACWGILFLARIDLHQCPSLCRTFWRARVSRPRPLRHSRSLAAAAPQAELHLLPCGHNDCPQAWTVIHAFLEHHGILEGRR